MQFLRRHWATVLILLTALVALAPALKPGAAIGPWDDLRAIMDGKPTPRAFDVLQMDAVLQFYGWRDLVFESWGRGEPPFWNPYQLMGTPLLANSQSGAFYPLHIAVGVLQIPTWLGVLLLAWFHLALAGLGARAFVLRLGGSEHGAAVAGACLAASPFMLSWVGLASVVTTCAWMPWALVFARDVIDRPSWRPVWWLSFALGMMVLGGHLQFAAYGFMAVAVYAGVQAFAQKCAARLLPVFAGSLLGLCLAAPQLVPVLEHSKNGHRQNKPTPEGYSMYVDRGAIKPYETLGLVFPDLLGTPGRAATDETEIPITSFWPAYTKIGGNYAESALYLGPPIVLLLALAAFRRGWREVAGVGAVGLFGLALALGTPLNKLLYSYLPGWSATGSPGRACVLFVVSACIVAGWAWPREGEQFCVRRPIYLLLGVSIVSIVLVALFASGLGIWREELRPVFEAAVNGNVSYALPVGLLALALTVAGAFAIERHRGYLASVAFVLATILIAGPRLVPAGTPLDKGSPDPTVRHAFVNQDWQLLIGLPVVQPPNTATIERKYDVAGYDSLINAETFAILNEINGRDSAPEANGNMTLIKPGFDESLLADAGVTRLTVRNPDGTTVTKDIEGPGRASLNGRPAIVGSDGTMHLIVQATGPGTLVVRDRNLPGWTARRGADMVSLGEGRWREIEIPEGTHQVKMFYTPPGLIPGLYGLTLWLLFTLFAWLKRPQ